MIAGARTTYEHIVLAHVETLEASSLDPNPHEVAPGQKVGGYRKHEAVIQNVTSPQRFGPAAFRSNRR